MICQKVEWEDEEKEVKVKCLWHRLLQCMTGVITVTAAESV